MRFLLRACRFPTRRLPETDTIHPLSLHEQCRTPASYKHASNLYSVPENALVNALVANLWHSRYTDSVMKYTEIHTAPTSPAESETVGKPLAQAIPIPTRKHRVAIITMGVKLGDETRGYTRFRFLSEALVRNGFDVDLYTSSFQHWNKARRDTNLTCYQGLPYTIRFIEEPGYEKNLDLKRIRSHAVAARNLRRMLEEAFANPSSAYDLVYAEIPPNDVALAAAETARKHGVPFVVDVNDLWPEAMRMVLDVPIISDIAYAPFARDARKVYRLISAAVGTSDEYAARPAADRKDPYRSLTVYVGSDLRAFDDGARSKAAEISKPEGEYWIAYAGTLGASYAIDKLIEAAALLPKTFEWAGAKQTPRVKILGDGPDRLELESKAAELDAPVDFVGYAPYDLMAAYLCASDATVNSLAADAPQSIVTKIGDYLAASIPLVNTGASLEMRALVETKGVGTNVAPENPYALAKALADLAADPETSERMGKQARDVAERSFDQNTSYQAIVDLIAELIETGD